MRKHEDFCTASACACMHGRSVLCANLRVLPNMKSARFKRTLLHTHMLARSRCLSLGASKNKGKYVPGLALVLDFVSS